jgi:hypothetical protein
VLTHGIRTIIIHNITSPKFKATVFSISNLPARWGTRIGYLKTAAEQVVDDARDHDGSIELAINAYKAGQKKPQVAGKTLLKDLKAAWKACPRAQRAEFVAEMAEEIIVHLKSRGQI